MKVVQIAHSYPPYIGGLSYVVENLSKNLAKLGFEVEVITLDVDGNLPKKEVANRITVKRFKGYAPTGGYFIPSKEFVNYVEGVNGDIVHIHNLGSISTYVAYRILRKRGLGYVLTPHQHASGFKWHAKILWKPYRLLAKSVVRHAVRVHAVSEYEASLIKRFYGIKPVIILNGICEDVFNYRWSPPEDSIILTYAGRVEGYKRVDMIIDVAAILIKQGFKNVKVKIVGKGPALNKAFKKARRLNVDLLYKPFLPREQYLKELSNSTMYINLSKYEAYSIVTAEALAMGIPAIIAKPWGYTLKDYGNAYIVEPNPLEVASKVLEIIENFETMPKGRSKVPTWTDVIEQIVKKLYEPIIDVYSR